MATPVKIVVQGSYSEEVPPERGELSIDVRDSGSSHEDVARHVEAAASEICKLIKAEAAGDKSTRAVSNYTVSTMHTSHYLEHPRDPSSSDQPSMRFLADISLTVVFNDFKRLSDFCLAMTQFPLAQVGIVQWSLKAETRKRIRTHALGEAYKDAFGEAEAIATAMNRPVLAPVSVEVNKEHDNPYGARTAMMQMQMQQIPRGAYSPEQPTAVPRPVRVMTSVSVTFECC